MALSLACPNPQDIERLVRGHLSEPEAERVFEHIAGCSQCTLLLGSLQADDPLVADLHAGAKRQLPDNTFVDELMERLVQRTADTNAASPSSEPATLVGALMPSPLVPGYEVLEVLGRGGQSIVYKARQRALDRLVALKMILTSGAVDTEERERFRREAEAVAHLQHPHIVQIHDVGEHAGRSYFALEYLSGGTLARRIAGVPLPAREAAQLLETLARTMHWAHQRGIVHRDLKPGNVLITADGTLKIADFGLAKRLETDATLTHTGHIMGTPSYMAPEQAAGKNQEVGQASDGYALGAILYEMLTGRPPFLGATALDILPQVIEAEPVSPRRWQPTVPRDLETICLKCLHKEPLKRYASAQALADDLAHFQAGEPIRARPVSQVERSLRWVRRNPVVAGLAAGLFVALTAGVVASTLFAVEAGSAARRANAQAQEAEREARAARQAEAHAEREARAARLAEGNAELEARAARLAEGHAEREARAARQAESNAKREARTAREREYGANMVSAQGAWEQHQVHRFVAVLEAQIPRTGQEDFRTFEWHYWRKLLRSGHFTLTGHKGAVNGVAFSPDGKWLASAGQDQTVKIWQVGTRQAVHTLKGHTGAVTCVVYSRDGKRLASASLDKTVKVWNPATGKEQLTLKGHKTDVRCVAFSPDGKQLVSGGAELTLWNATTGQETPSTFKKQDGWFNGVAFSPDGQRLAAAHSNGTVKVLNAVTGQEIFNLKGDFFRHGSAMVRVAYSPNGKRLVSCGGFAAKVWDAVTGRGILTFKDHNHWVMAVAFSPDGKRVASVGANQTVKVWEAATGQEVLNLQAHTAPIGAVAFSPDGKRLASGSHDGTVKVWDAINGQEPLTLKGTGIGTDSVGLAFSPDSKRLASTSGGGTVKVWDVKRAREVLTIKDAFGRVSFSPDGKRLAAASHGGKLKLWDAVTGREALTLTGYRAVTFSKDGKRLAAPGADNTVKVWDAVTGKVLLTLKGHTGPVNYVAFSPDGKRLASGGDCYDSAKQRSVRGEVKLWNSGTGKEVFTLVADLTPGADRDRVQAVAFSPNGKRLAAACFDGTVKVWDTATGQAVFTLRGHTSLVYGVAFSPDGKRLASASWDNTVMVWDTATGLEVLTFRQFPSGVWSVAFSPDGKRLAATSDNGLVMIWDADSGE